MHSSAAAAHAAKASLFPHSDLSVRVRVRVWVEGEGEGEGLGCSGTDMVDEKSETGKSVCCGKEAASKREADAVQGGH
jgi:hypothetical protein